MTNNSHNKSKSGNVIDLILLKRVLKYARPYKKQFVIAAISAIFLSILGPLRPFLINYGVDNYIIEPDLSGLRNITILLLIVLFLEAVLQFFYIYLSTWLGQSVIQDLRNKVFKHIISLRMKYFDNTPIGTLVTRAISDIETISDIFSQGLLVIIAELLKLIVVVLMMFYIDWRLSLISMISIPFLLISTSWFKRNIKRVFQDVRNYISNLNTFVQEHIVGMNIVQIFNREKAEYNKFHKINTDHRDANIKGIFYYAVFFPIVEILSAVSIAFVVWYGGEAILRKEDVTVGELIAFILYIHMMFRPIRQLADRFNILQMGIVGSERVFKVLDTKEKILNECNTKIGDIKGNISFERVCFSYKKDEPVLDNISFSIRKGQMLALVGKTGAGKTSIINILNRFYEIDSGSIKIDDINVKSLSLHDLRKNICLVQQDVFLFSDTILNNIKLYDENITKSQVIKAAQEIGLNSFINSLPGKYNYIVSERGVTLSAGQRQLIAFLRVYVRNPRVLVLDEATASIDTKTEELLQNALFKISRQITTIVIAHRLSTIIDADKILHLMDGKIIAEGTHEELLEKDSLYAKMYHSQTGKS